MRNRYALMGLLTPGCALLVKQLASCDIETVNKPFVIDLAHVSTLVNVCSVTIVRAVFAESLGLRF